MISVTWIPRTHVLDNISIIRVLVAAAVVAVIVVVSDLLWISQITRSTYPTTL